MKRKKAYRRHITRRPRGRRGTWSRFQREAKRQAHVLTESAKLVLFYGSILLVLYLFIVWTR
jgi:hypothetical protein